MNKKVSLQSLVYASLDQEEDGKLQEKLDDISLQYDSTVVKHV